MRNFKIILDSLSDFNFVLSEKYDIDIVSIKYYINEVVFDDPIGIDREKKLKDFYKKIKNDCVVKTSQINPKEFELIFEKYIEKGFDILYIGCSQIISGTVNSARIAAEILNEKYPNNEIIIIDSLSASLGEGLLAIEASKKRAEGFNILQCSDFLEEFKKRIYCIGIVDDLDYLKRGGRVSSSIAFFGKFLDFKPIITIIEGKVQLSDKKRGRNNALEYIVSKLKEKISDSFPTVYLSYNESFKEEVNIDKNIEEFENKMKSEIKNFDLVKSLTGIALTGHTGLGLIACFCVSREN